MIRIPYVGGIHVVTDVLVPVLKYSFCIPIGIFNAAVYCCCPEKSKKKKVKILTPPVKKNLSPEELAKIKEQERLTELLRQKVGRILSVEGDFSDKPKNKPLVISQSYHAGYTVAQREGKESDPDMRALAFVEQNEGDRSQVSTPPIKIPKRPDNVPNDEDDFFDFGEPSRTHLHKSLNALDDFEL